MKLINTEGFTHQAPRPMLASACMVWTRAGLAICRGMELFNAAAWTSFTWRQMTTWGTFGKFASGMITQVQGYYENVLFFDSTDPFFLNLYTLHFHLLEIKCFEFHFSSSICCFFFFFFFWRVYIIYVCRSGPVLVRSARGGLGSTDWPHFLLPAEWLALCGESQEQYCGEGSSCFM